MKVKELVEKYNNNQRIDIAKELEVNQYISIALKREIAHLVLENCSTVVDGETHIDSVEKYILFTITVISTHTNLEFSDEHDEDYSPINDYDALCQSGLLVKIIALFQDDYAACQEILNMMTVDKMQNNMTIEKKIYKFFDTIEDVLSGEVNHLSNELNLDNIMGELPAGKDALVELRNILNEK